MSHEHIPEDSSSELLTEILMAPHSTLETAPGVHWGHSHTSQKMCLSAAGCAHTTLQLPAGGCIPLKFLTWDSTLFHLLHCSLHTHYPALLGYHGISWQISTRVRLITEVFTARMELCNSPQRELPVSTNSSSFAPSLTAVYWVYNQMLPREDIHEPTDLAEWRFCLPKSSDLVGKKKSQSQNRHLVNAGQ